MRMFAAAVGFCLVLGTSTTALAQAGLVVGVNFATIEYNDPDAPEFDRRTGFAAGIFQNIRLGDYVSVQPEALYSQKGAKLQEGGGETTIEVDYLDVPVLVRVSGGRGGGLVVFGGPSFGFKLRARAKGEFDGESEEVDIGDEVEDFDLGVVAGAGIGSARYFLDVRYQWGLSDADKDQTDDTEVKNRVISIFLGFRF